MHKTRKLPAIFCAIALMVTLLPFTAQAADVTYERADQISQGLTLTTLRQKLDSGSARQMATLDFTPGGATRPIVVYGSKVYGKLTVNSAISYAESLGYTVMAAVNADYFNTSTGVPTGMLIQQGRLVVSDGAWNAVGIFTDGSAISGTPRLSMSLTRPSNGQTMPIYALNKVRTNAGLYLYSDDFSSTTRTTNPGTEVILEVVSGDYLALGRPLTLRVVSAAQTTATALGPNRFVLSATNDNTAGLSLADFEPGEEITIMATTADERWHSVYYSTGGGNMLVQNGVATSAAVSGADPRTVLGVRPDGSMSVLVCDGRQSGLSNGMSLAEAAQVMISRGCTDVINLDGGGSSSASARYAGEHQISLITSPSDGALRQCSTFILFVTTGDAQAPESNISVYPKDPILLAGAAVELTALSFNDAYYPGRQYYDCFAVTEGGGWVSGNVYTSPTTPGQARVDASLSGFSSVGTVVQIVDSAPIMRVVRSGSTAAITSLSLATGEEMNLDVYLSDGLREIICQDSQFTFTATGDIGVFGENGVFTATTTPGLSGSITVSYGSMSVTIPVTVGSAPNVLEDFEGSPSYSASAQLETTTAAATVSHSAESARYGAGGLYLTYAAQDATEVVRYTAASPISLRGASVITLMAKGYGYFSIDFATPSGLSSVAMTVTDSWNQITVNVPSGATGIAGFSAAVGDTPRGNLSVDQIMGHSGAAVYDTKPPVIGAVEFDGLAFSATVTDNYPIPLTKDMITLTVDSKALGFDFDANTGRVSATLPEAADGLHRITILATDHFMNTARHSVTFGQTEAWTFNDTNGHWAGEYAEYLCKTGVFSVDSAFRPQAEVTNAMAATMISRYLGIDTSRYQSVELPYYDTFNIPDWALPHVKAMYALEIMVGSHDGANRVFYPMRSSSRAQIMTILGRTIPRGYAYGRAAYDDYSQIPSWAIDHIDLLSSLEIVTGYGGSNEVRAQNTITRGEFASLLFKLY